MTCQSISGFDGTGGGLGVRGLPLYTSLKVVPPPLPSVFRTQYGHTKIAGNCSETLDFTAQCLGKKSGPKNRFKPTYGISRVFGGSLAPAGRAAALWSIIGRYFFPDFGIPSKNALVGTLFNHIVLYVHLGLSGARFSTEGGPLRCFFVSNRFDELLPCFSLF